MKVWRRTSTNWVLAGLLLVLMLLAFCFGAVWIEPSRLLASPIFRTVRLPRVLSGAAAGSALAVSGYLIQSVLANPMASPGLLGVNSGAAVGSALAGLLVPGLLLAGPLGALAGAVLAAFLILFLARRTRSSRLGVVLAGLAISQIFSAALDLILVLDDDAIAGYADFKLGSLAGTGYERMLPGLVLIGIGLVLALLFAPECELLSLGEEQASSLGLHTEKWRGWILFTAAMLAGAAVSFGGLISFVGLLVPHIVRHFKPASTREAVVGCLLGGADLLLACDLVGRLVFAPYEVPVGILLSLLGGPYFLYLLLHARRRHG